MQETIITKTIGPIFQLDKCSQTDLTGKWIFIQVNRDSKSDQEICQIAEINPNERHELIYKPVNSKTEFFAVSNFNMSSETTSMKVYRYELGAGEIYRDFRTETKLENFPPIVRIIPERIQRGQGSFWNLTRNTKKDQDKVAPYPSLTEAQNQSLYQTFENYLLKWDNDAWKEIAKKRIKEQRIKGFKEHDLAGSQSPAIEKLKITDSKLEEESPINTKKLSKTQKYQALDYIMEAWKLLIDNAASYEEYKEVLKAVIEGNVISLDNKINEVLANEARNLRSYFSETELNRLNSKNFSDVSISTIYDYLTGFMLTEFNAEEKKKIKIPLLSSAAKCAPGQLDKGNVDNNLATVYRGLSSTAHDKLSLLQQVLQGGINELDISQLKTLNVLINDMLTKEYSSDESLEIANDYLATEQARTDASPQHIYEQTVKSFKKTQRSIETYIQFKEGKKIELNNQDPDYYDILIKILNFSPSAGMITVLNAFGIKAIKNLANDYSQLVAFLENLTLQKVKIILTNYFDSLPEIISKGSEFLDIYENLPEEIEEKFFKTMEPRFAALKISGVEFCDIYDVLPEIQKDIFFNKLENTLADNTHDIDDFYGIMITIPEDRRDQYFKSVESKLVTVIKKSAAILSVTALMTLQENLSPKHLEKFRIAYIKATTPDTIGSSATGMEQNVYEESDSDDENSDSSSNSM